MKAHITNIQCPTQRCGFGEGATWAEAVADALLVEPRAFVDYTYSPEGDVLVDFSVSI